MGEITDKLKEKKVKDEKDTVLVDTTKDGCRKNKGYSG